MFLKYSYLLIDVTYDVKLIFHLNNKDCGKGIDLKARFALSQRRLKPTFYLVNGISPLGLWQLKLLLDFIQTFLIVNNLVQFALFDNCKRKINLGRSYFLL